MELHLNYFQGWAATHKVISLSAIIVAYLGLYILGLTIYRLVFSNLAVFPGPKIAAATYWYEFYHDWLRKGKYIFVIEEMHKKYGNASKEFFLSILYLGWLTMLD